MNIKYCGPSLDYSGYGEANRHDIAALMSAGVDVSVELTRHCLEISDFGQLGKKIQDATNKGIDYKVKILHVTPNIYGRFIEPGKYHIGRVIWETDKLPPDFVAGCQLVDEIWTASEYNKQAIINSGINLTVDLELKFSRPIHNTLRRYHLTICFNRLIIHFSGPVENKLL